MTYGRAHGAAAALVTLAAVSMACGSSDADGNDIIPSSSVDMAPVAPSAWEAATTAARDTGAVSTFAVVVTVQVASDADVP